MLAALSRGVRGGCPGNPLWGPAAGDGTLSLEELNRTLASVGLAPLSPAERQTIEQQIGTQAMRWSDFVRLLLLT
jgi:hypothetical protein